MPEFTLAPEEANLLRLLGQRDKATLPELGVMLHYTPTEVHRWVERLAASNLLAVTLDGAVVSVTSQGKAATRVLESGKLSGANVQVTVVSDRELTGAA